MSFGSRIGENSRQCHFYVVDKILCKYKLEQKVFDKCSAEAS